MWNFIVPISHHLVILYLAWSVFGFHDIFDHKKNDEMPPTANVISFLMFFIDSFRLYAVFIFTFSIYLFLSFHHFSAFLSLVEHQPKIV